MFLTLMKVSTHFEHLLATLYNLCPQIYLNENFMSILGGKSVFPDGVRHNWSLRKLSRVAGPGSGVMMELRDVLRPISSRWINGYIEILATAIAGCLFHRIRDFAPRQPDIFFSEIVSRGKFRSSLQREEFDGKRRTVNNKMKKILGRTFIRIDVRFPRHYLPDEIHLHDAGTVIFLLSISKTVKSRSSE
uniref:Uncharacterized protein n=1 Tax=Magallana gigas TaxID=29159 RepID=A0A8W8LYR6_MAGGI